MSYNKEELLNLPAEEKYELVMDLWESLDKDFAGDSEEEISFAKERLQNHNETPSEGLSWTEVANKVKEKYGL